MVSSERSSNEMIWIKSDLNAIGSAPNTKSAIKKTKTSTNNWEGSLTLNKVLIDICAYSKYSFCWDNLVKVCTISISIFLIGSISDVSLDNLRSLSESSWVALMIVSKCWLINAMDCSRTLGGNWGCTLLICSNCCCCNCCWSCCCWSCCCCCNNNCFWSNFSFESPSNTSAGFRTPSALGKLASIRRLSPLPNSS